MSFYFETFNYSQNSKIRLIFGVEYVKRLIVTFRTIVCLLFCNSSSDNKLEIHF